MKYYLKLSEETVRFIEDAVYTISRNTGVTRTERSTHLHKFTIYAVGDNLIRIDIKELPENKENKPKCV
jgi:hypothetical protein